MRKPYYTLLFSIMLILSSCDYRSNSVTEDGKSGYLIEDWGHGNQGYVIREMKYKGHIYIYTYIQGGVSLAHAGHCPCNNKKP